MGLFLQDSGEGARPAAVSGDTLARHGAREATRPRPSQSRKLAVDLTPSSRKSRQTPGGGGSVPHAGGARRSRQKPGSEAGDRSVSEPPQGTNGLSSAAGGRRVSVILSRPPACCALFRRLQRTGREPAGEASRFRGRMPSVTLVPAPPVQLLSGHWTERDGHTGTSDRSSTGTAGRGRCSAELPRDQGARRRRPAGTSCLQGEGFAKHR